MGLIQSSLTSKKSLHTKPLCFTADFEVWNLEGGVQKFFSFATKQQKYRF